MSLSFQKRKEDFECGNCGRAVKGDGYTNHCPVCLWSRHVDQNPGDRKETCGGLMKPVGLEINGSEYTIIHKCQKCGAIKKNKSAMQDNFAEILKLSKQN
ncbi:RNHCP domain-containing protein [bacterium]|nr:MAG: RNHCP domain-containing protein [bacterium]